MARQDGCECPSVWHGIYPPHCPVHNPVYKVNFPIASTTDRGQWDWGRELLKLKFPEKGPGDTM